MPTPPSTPYGTARDLPSYREMDRMAKTMSFFGLFMGSKQRSENKKLRNDIERLFDEVEQFYALLGRRHWIYHGRLPATKMQAIFADYPSADVTEERLVAIEAERLAGDYWWIGLRIDGLKQRRHLLERARQHYLDEQWDSCALLLVTVMDGFVNDFEPDRRRGLAARDEEDEMFAWDNVVGHHLGLTWVMKETFLKTIKKRIDEEVFEVHRHGIVHGSVVNYNNQIVATKAWNMLFAVVDWAEATTKAAKPVEPPATWSDVKLMLAERVERKRSEEAFEAHRLMADDDGFVDNEVVQLCETFFKAWKKQQWGPLAEFTPKFMLGEKRPGELAKQAKRTFRFYPLTEHQLAEVDFPRLSVAVVTGTATVAEQSGSFSIRFVRCDSRGEIDLTGKAQGGTWEMVRWAPEVLVEAKHST